MKDTYYGLLSEALQYMLPPGVRYGRERAGTKRQMVVKLVESKPVLSERAVAQRRVVETLQKSGPMLASELVSLAEASYQTLDALARKSIIEISQQQIERRAEDVIQFLRRAS